MHRQVTHCAHPFGTLRFAKSGMRRHLNRETAREGIVKRQPSRIADVMMQHKERAAASCAQHLNLAAGNLNEAFSRCHARSFFSGWTFAATPFDAALLCTWETSGEPPHATLTHQLNATCKVKLPQL